MQITGLGWSGIRTDYGDELAAFYESVLGLETTHMEPGFWVFRLPDGRNVEVFGTDYPGKEHFNTGPVVGFAVSDLKAAVFELQAAGVELLGQSARPGNTSAARTATSMNSSQTEKITTGQQGIDTV